MKIHSSVDLKLAVSDCTLRESKYASLLQTFMVRLPSSAAFLGELWSEWDKSPFVVVPLSIVIPDCQSMLG